VVYWLQLALQAFSTGILFTRPVVEWLNAKPPAEPVQSTVFNAVPTTTQPGKTQCPACKAEITEGQKYCPSCGTTVSPAATQISKPLISNTAGSIIGVIGLVLVGGYVFASLNDSVNLSVSVRPIREGADAEAYALIRVTNLSATPIIVQQVSANGRTDSKCVVKTNSTLKKGDSFDAMPNLLFGFWAPSCGKVLQATVVTDAGTRDYKINW
jgi:hypothetical protein